MSSFHKFCLCYNNFFFFQVQARHVAEAYKLLNQSIIRVEQPDVYLDEEETDEPTENQDQGTYLNHYNLKSSYKKNCSFLNEVFLI